MHAAAFAATLAFAHLVWGGAQLIPIVPFRTGMALSARFRPSYRFVHAAGSLVFVVATGVLGVSSTQSPVVFGAFIFAALACAQVVREAYRESCDAWRDTDEYFAVIDDRNEVLFDGAGDERFDLGVDANGAVIGSPDDGAHRCLVGDRQPSFPGVEEMPEDVSLGQRADVSAGVVENWNRPVAVRVHFARTPDGLWRPPPPRPSRSSE